MEGPTAHSGGKKMPRKLLSSTGAKVPLGDISMKRVRALRRQSFKIRIVEHESPKRFAGAAGDNLG